MSKFSIITPTYNRAKLLPRAIESVLRQDFTDWEMIIVDDGSTDETASVVEKYLKKDGRVKYFRKPNGGVGSARNLGVEKSSGDYLIFLDSDDELLAGALGVVKESVVRHKSYDIWTFGAVNEEFRLMYKMKQPVQTVECLREFLDDNRRPQGEMISCFKADIFRKKGFRFPEEVNGGETILWQEMAATNLKMIYFDKPIRLYHFDAGNSLSRNRFDQEKIANLCQINMLLTKRLGSEYLKIDPRLLGKLYFKTAIFKTFLREPSKKYINLARSYGSFGWREKLLYLTALLDRKLLLLNLLVKMKERFKRVDQ